jgi:hypothetical protein
MSWEPPEDQDFIVTVSLPNGDPVHEWSGYADNTTEALYKTLETWDELYRANMTEEPRGGAAR